MNKVLVRRFRNKILASVIAGIGLLSLTAFQQRQAPTVCCKDCGTTNNCWQANGLNSGYQDCYINWGQSPPCVVTGWGDCTNSCN